MATRTIRTENSETVLSASSGDSLRFTIRVAGPVPLFALINATSNTGLLSSQSAPASPGVWSRDWPLPADHVNIVTDCALGMTFLSAITYTYKVEYIRGAAPISTLIDIDYSSTGADTADFQNLRVVTI